MATQIKVEESMTLKMVRERAGIELEQINSRELELVLADRDNFFNVRDVVAAALWKTDLIEAVMLRKIYEAIIKIDMSDPSSVEKWAEELNRTSQNPLAIKSMKSIKKQTTEEKRSKEECSIHSVENEKKETDKKLRNIVQRQDTEKVEMNGKISRQSSSAEEEERKKRHKREEEEILQQIDVTEVPLEQSIWAPDNRPCDNEEPATARIPTYNVPGGTKEKRIGMVKWMLNANRHLIKVEEVFVKGNSWIVVSFDCKRGRKEAIDRLNKKDEGWFKMISDETKSRVENKEGLDNEQDKSRTKTKQNKESRKEEGIEDIRLKQEDVYQRWIKEQDEEK